MAPIRRSQRIIAAAQRQDATASPPISPQQNLKRRRSVSSNPPTPPIGLGNVENTPDDSGIAITPTPKRRRSARINDVAQDVMLSTDSSMRDGNYDTRLDFTPAPELQQSAGFKSVAKDVSLIIPDSDEADDSAVDIFQTPSVSSQDHSSPASVVSNDFSWDHFQEIFKDIAAPNDIDWSDIFFRMLPEASKIAKDVRLFVSQIRSREWPKSNVNPTAFIDDPRRDIQPLVGDSYNMNSMAKPSGPFGAILYIQWHYPTWRTNKKDINFRHVLDPNNPSLRQQFKKIGDSSSVSTSDMIPFRNTAQSPN
ncbi:hypothetical protein V8C35DRAFT_284080 [Trichoderma chlorosporum]